MANRYDTNLILDRIADALDDDQNSALIDALTTIANAISQSGGGDIPSGGTMGQLLGKRSNQDFDLTWYDNMGDDALSNQASIYNPQSNYVVGDYCLHTNYLHVCISPTTGNWDPTCWNRVQFGGQLSTLNSNITTKTRAITAASSIAQNTISCRQIGDLFIISGYVRVSANSSLAAGTTMFTINNFEGFSSGSSRYGVASVGNGASLEPLSRSCRINNSGQVFIEDVSTPASYYITIMLVFTLH